MDLKKHYADLEAERELTEQEINNLSEKVQGMTDEQILQAIKKYVDRISLELYNQMFFEEPDPVKPKFRNNENDKFRIVYLFRKDSYFQSEILKPKEGVIYGVPDIVDAWIDYEVWRIFTGERSPEESQSKSFTWQGNEGELNPIFERLQSENLIDSNATLEQFKKIFSGVPLAEVTPTRWTGQKNLLPYFINSLYNMNRLDKYTDTNMWDITAKCFAGVDNLRQLAYGGKESNRAEPRNSSIIKNSLHNLQ